MKQSFKISTYLLIIQTMKHRNAIAELRLSSHQLNIETGRHTSIERLDRRCNVCILSDLEDEYHFTLICPIYKDLRITRPKIEIFKAVEFKRSKKLNNFAAFILKAFK